MIINEKPLFQKCLIKRKTNIKENPLIKDTSPDEDKVELIVNEINKKSNPDLKENVEEDVEEDVEEVVSQNVVNEDPGEQDEQDEQDEPEDLEKEDKEEIKKEEEVQEEIVDGISAEPSILENSGNILPKFKETLTIEHLEKNGQIKEIDLNIMADDEPLKLKKPNEVYLEIYKKARRKAKDAKKMAIRAFLEAKRIKNTYLLDDIEDDSDSLSDLSDFNDYEEPKQEIALA